ELLQLLQHGGLALAGHVFLARRPVGHDKPVAAAAVDAAAAEANALAPDFAAPAVGQGARARGDATPAEVAGVDRLAVADQLLSANRVDAVGADQRVRFDHGAVGKVNPDAALRHFIARGATAEVQVVAPGAVEQDLVQRRAVDADDRRAHLGRQ